MIEISDRTDLPLYQRIIDGICEAVASGRVVPGDKLPARSALAKHLGVSPVTVGRSYELLERRGIIVQKHGSGTYVQAEALQHMQAGGDPASDCIAVVGGTDDLFAHSIENDYYLWRVLAGIEDVLGRRAGRFSYVPSLTRECLGDLPDRSAVLFRKATEVDPTMLEDLRRRSIPVLNIWGHESDLIVPHVRCDQTQAAHLAVEHLLSCGHRRLGFIGTMGGRNPLGMHFFEFTDALFRAGLDFSVKHVRDVPARQPGAAYEAARQIIQSGDIPEAFYVQTDYKAMEVIRALKTGGLRVPEDVSVVGHLDIPEAADYDPPLTTVRIPFRELGQQVAHMLLAWARDRTPLEHASLAPTLIVRESTRRITEKPTGPVLQLIPPV